MHLKFTKPLAAFCAAATVAFLCAASASATSLIPGHNGTLNTHPNHPSDPGGTGISNVQLTCALNIPAAGPTEFCDKNFFSNDRHEISWQGEGFLRETVINSTGIPWTDFHLDWSGFSLVQLFTDSISCSAGTSEACISPPMMMGDSSSGGLWYFFTEPFFPGTATNHSFSFTLKLEGNGTLHQYPSIPEPGTLALFGLGLAGLGFARRRKAA